MSVIPVPTDAPFTLMTTTAVPATQEPRSIAKPEYRDVEVGDLTIPEDRLRPVDEEGLDGLVESIQISGVLEPPIVDPSLTVVAGVRRVYAAKAAGMKTITVAVRSLDELHRQLVEIDENLCRTELSHLQRARHLARRKALYEQLHPEARRGGNRGIGGGGKLPNDIPGFVDDVSTQTGRGKSTVFEDCKVGSMPSDVLDSLVGTPIENKKGQLLLMAKEAEDVQRAVAAAIQAGHAESVKDALFRLEAESGDREGSEEADGSDGNDQEPCGLPAIYSNLEEIEAALEHAANGVEVLTQLERAWRDDPGPDIDPVMIHVLRARTSMAMAKTLIERHVLPDATCGECGGSIAACDCCGGKGWLSKEEVARIDAEGATTERLS